MPSEPPRPAPPPRRDGDENYIVAPDYDWPDYAGPLRPYVLAESPRSGSQLLADLLWRTGRMGSPGEYFHREHVVPHLSRRLGVGGGGERQAFEAYLRAIVRRRTTPNGVFGLKTHFMQLHPYLGQPAARRFLRHSRFIWLRRRDVLAQAISYLVALRSGEWRRREDGDRVPPRGDFSDRALQGAVSQIAGDERAWEMAFGVNRIRPMVVWYEDLVADPEPVCQGICALLGVTEAGPFRIADSQMRRQVEPLKDELRARYVERLAWSRQEPAGQAGSAPSSHGST